MGLVSFLSELFADGRVRVSADAPSPDELERVDAVLLAFEQQQRDGLPGTPPEISLDAARFGAVMLYRACQFLVFRDVEPETIEQVLSGTMKKMSASATHYSADLTLQYLPDVIRLARVKSEEDPLGSELLQLASRWPLSSVGIVGVDQGGVDQGGVDQGDVTAIVTDRCLLQLYVDRIMARHDYQRFENEHVRNIALRAIGAFPELAPEAAAALGVADSTCNLQEKNG